MLNNVPRHCHPSRSTKETHYGPCRMPGHQAHPGTLRDNTSHCYSVSIRQCAFNTFWFTAPVRVCSAAEAIHWPAAWRLSRLSLLSYNLHSSTWRHTGHVLNVLLWIFLSARVQKSRRAGTRVTEYSMEACTAEGSAKRELAASHPSGVYTTEVVRRCMTNFRALD